MAIAASFPNLRPSLLLDFANAKAVDPRITFTRSTTAKYYDGVTTAKAEENLFTHSENFAAWTSTRSSVTDNQVVAPDGTLTGDRLVEDTTATDTHFVRQSASYTSGTTYTHSIYAKADSPNRGLQLYTTASIFGTNGAHNFDLTTGVATQAAAGGVISYGMTPVGNGWYRCWVTAQATATVSNFIEHRLLDTSVPTSLYTGDGTSGIFIWGAQLEARSQATAYTPTTTQPITNYIPVLQTAAAGVPRIDHDPVTGECLGLLIEEQRTNLLLYSEQFDNAAWTKTNATITANTVVAPDGALTGDKLVEDSAASVKQVRQSSISVTSGVTYTGTVYAKAGERNWLVIELGGTPLACLASVNLSNGAVGVQSGSPTSVTATLIGNGWYRISITKTAVSTALANFALYPASGDNITNYTGDGYSGIFIWGAQLEVGGFPTSQITTVATQQTRNADAASMTGTNFSSWYRQDQGTVYCEASGATAAAAALATPFAVVGTSDANKIQYIYADNRQFYVYAPSAVQADIDAGSVTAGAVVKLTGTYQTNNFAVSLNGSAIVTDVSGILPTVSEAHIGRNPYQSSSINGHIRKIAYYPQRLTNANLQALTA